MRKILLLGLAAFVLLSCDSGLPSLRVEHGTDSVTVHLETLGEYPTSVGRLLLADVQSGQTIWELRRLKGTPQLWKVAFRAGENPAEPAGVTGGGSFEVVRPQGASSFDLEPGGEYRLTVWSEAGHSSRTTSFKLESDPEQSVSEPAE